MAEMVLKNGFLSVGGTDLSNHVKSMTLKLDRDAQENTAMSDNSRSRILGLKDSTLDVEFNQDFAGGSVDATLWGVFDGGVAVAIVVRPDAGAKAATNPEYGGQMILPSYPPIDGSVGSAATTKVTFQGSGDIGRTTS